MNTRWPMLKHGNLHYQVRQLSSWCHKGNCGDCDGPYWAGGPLLGLCTCDCHAYNRAEVAS